MKKIFIILIILSTVLNAFAQHLNLDYEEFVEHPPFYKMDNYTFITVGGVVPVDLWGYKEYNQLLQKTDEGRLYPMAGVNLAIGNVFFMKKTFESKNNVALKMTWADGSLFFVEHKETNGLEQETKETKLMGLWSVKAGGQYTIELNKNLFVDTYAQVGYVMNYYNNDFGAFGFLVDIGTGFRTGHFNAGLNFSIIPGINVNTSNKEFVNLSQLRLFVGANF